MTRWTIRVACVLAVVWMLGELCAPSALPPKPPPTSISLNLNAVGLLRHCDALPPCMSHDMKYEQLEHCAALQAKSCREQQDLNRRSRTP